MPPKNCGAITRLVKNMQDVDRLIAMHKDITGDASGRRWGAAVLNKSAVVMVTACWEAFIEDLAKEAFEFLIKHVRTPEHIPDKVKALAAEPLKEHEDPTKVWQLAGRGWRSVLKTHSKKLKKKHIGSSFNTAKPDNIDGLFESLVGLRSLSASWKWRGMSASRARSKLTKYVEDRGAIAHRVKPRQAITKDHAYDYRDFVHRLAVKSTNRVSDYLLSVVGKRPWLKCVIR